nr:MAG TPA: nuclease [Caudoviricetes sp.]
MGEDTLFTEKDPFGNAITLSTDRYNQHIVQESGHTDVYPDDIKSTISSPAVIYQSSQRPSRNVYFAKTAGRPPFYTKVAAEIDESTKTGAVVTAFTTKKIAGGINEERGPLYIARDNKL